MGFLHVGIKNVSDEDRQFSCHIGVFVKNRLDSIGAISFFLLSACFVLLGLHELSDGGEAANI